MTNVDPPPLRRWLRRRGANLGAGWLLPAQKHRQSQFAILGPRKGAVVFLGDSITHEGIWDEWFPGLAVSNRGIGGERVEDLAVRLDTAICDPAAVVLLIGTNNLAAGDTVEETLVKFEPLLDQIVSRLGDAPLFLLSVFPRDVGYRGQITELNTRYRLLAHQRESAVRYVDLWPVLATSEGGIRPELSLDRLHLNGEGYRLWTQELRPLLEEALAGGLHISGMPS